MNYFIITPGDDGLRISRALTFAEAAERLRPGSGGEDGVTYYGRDLRIVDHVPERENEVLVLRGEVVTAEEIRACPCGSGKAFSDCHGAPEDDGIAGVIADCAAEVRTWPGWKISDDVKRDFPKVGL